MRKVTNMAHTRSRTKRRNGSGSYWYVPVEDRWRAHFTDNHGLSRTLSAKTEQDIISALEAALVRRNAGLLGLPPNQVPTLRDWLIHWLSTKTDMSEQGQARHSTDIHQYLIPMLGQVRLGRLDPATVELAYTRHTSQPSLRRQSGLSASSVRRVHATLRSALNDAYRLGDIRDEQHLGRRRGRIGLSCR